MNIETLAAMRKGTEPFRPFSIRLKDGSVVHVMEREQFSGPENWEMMVCFQRWGDFKFIDREEIAEITELAEQELAEQIKPKNKMTNEILEQLKAEPFQPFKLHLSDGRSIQIDHPDQICLSPDRVRVGLGRKGAHYFERIELISIVHVTSVEALSN